MPSRNLGKHGASSRSAGQLGWRTRSPLAAAVNVRHGSPGADQARDVRRALAAVVALCILPVTMLARTARADDGRPGDATSKLLDLARAQAGVGKLVDADASYTAVLGTAGVAGSF